MLASMRPARTAGVALGAALLGLLVAAAGTARGQGSGRAVTELAVGTVQGELAVTVSGPRPFVHTVTARPGSPFILTVVLPDSRLAVPAATREVDAGPLRQVAIAAGAGGETGAVRLDLTFDRPVTHRVVADGESLSVRIAAPGVPTRVLLRGAAMVDGMPMLPAEMPVAPPPSVASRALPPAPDPPPLAPPPAAESPGPAPEAVAETPAAPAPASRVLRISVAATAPHTQIQVHADGPLPGARSFVLLEPLRLVVDFEGAGFAATQSVLAVGTPLVERVRISRFRPPPREVVRVVLELARPAPHWIEPRPDGVVVHVGAAGP
jgi:hypothetical protein